jgi:uncharacterized protein YeaO (DUF488 family)
LETLKRKTLIMPVAIKRAYEKPSRSDGQRVLVDRLWPRGLSKQTAKIDSWLKNLSPSNELRKWYHASDDWTQFKKRYFEELRSAEASADLETLYSLIESQPQVTLIYSSRNLERNNATALKELLDGTKKPPSSSGPVRAGASARAGKRRPS